MAQMPEPAYIPRGVGPQTSPVAPFRRPGFWRIIGHCSIRPRLATTPMNPESYPLLFSLQDTADIRRMSMVELLQLNEELRAFLIESVSRSGGHFGANLGCVELTVALQHVFETPHDRIIWDVGHQAYPHKILTGRRDRIHTIKQKDGLSPFPKRAESEHDAFGVGHSSTSISAGVGMALASELQGQPRKVVSIIGDGAITAGMAYEALNHGGELDPNLLVILNENQMSISPNVGGMTRMLGRLVAGNHYTQLRERTKKLMKRDTHLWRFMSRWEEHVKGMFVPSTLFEELGFNYFGPIDGHDLPHLVRSLQTLKALEGPQFLHIITQKGKGYAPAETDPVRYHAVTPFEPKVGMQPVQPETPPPPTYTEIFSQWVCDMAEADPTLVAITPAMREGSGLVAFSERFPDRYFDVGIAEQHAVTLAAGMACEGIRPVVAIYSTFLQRAYDQLIHDVAIQNLPVTFAIDRAGLVGPDGPTHAGSFDLSFLRCIPNLVIMAPSDENECRAMLTTAHRHPGPAAVRYPRERGTGVEVDSRLEPLEIGKGRMVRQGRQVALLAFGSVLQSCHAIAEELDATLVDMRFIKPLDEHLLSLLAENHALFITLEENAVAGGAGSAVSEWLARQGLALPIAHIGLPDRFVEHASRPQILADAGLDEQGIRNQIEQAMARFSLNRPLSVKPHTMGHTA